ncbi:MAG: glycosyltransferase [Acidobacteriaceae bacterium]
MSVYQDALGELSRNFAAQYDIVALVHRRELFTIPGVQFIEYPEIRSSWIKRVKFEYYDLYRISRELDAYLWLSLHDITPRIHAKIQAVYCHNPAPFSRLKLPDFIHDWRYSAFVLFYRYLYRINIHRNDYVIVQQAWMRDRFQKMYGVKNVVVAHPKLEAPLEKPVKDCAVSRPPQGKFRFFYPAYPRVFKNVEILLEAAMLLKSEAIEIWLTFSGEEGRYARKLVEQYRHLDNVKFLGRLTREQVFERYEATDCLVFPSRLETWGLPISEFKGTGKPMLLADLPYAHETVGTYGAVSFFHPDEPKELASLMQKMSLGQMRPESAVAADIAAPFAAGWRELFDILLQTEQPSGKT